MVKSDWLKLVVCLLLTLGIGLVGGLFTASQIQTWYVSLNKPSFNPPNWIFAPVWSTLYILMGISLFLIIRKPASVYRTQSLQFFSTQFILNFCWSFIFFNQHQIGLALLDIILMWVFILLTIIWFSRQNAIAGWLLIPYLFWVSFATILNAAILRLN
ncbi:MAG: tryptophan-rich sensory protein [Sediminibacterium sp.]|jgi:benzodiazapine receptor|nr:tryptophan-rich sensory protein [Sediminibacterium sp.]MBX9781627.1 tryptophan-rich sensory protein [Chitinophagaceae bacterium]